MPPLGGHALPGRRGAWYSVKFIISHVFGVGRRVPSPPCACLAHGFAFMPPPLSHGGQGTARPTRGRQIRMFELYDVLKRFEIFCSFFGIVFGGRMPLQQAARKKTSVPPSSGPSVFAAAGMDR